MFGGFLRMKKSITWSTSVFLIFAILAACAGMAGSNSTLSGNRILEPKDANALIEKNKGNPNFIVLDVRTPDEFSEGHIAGAINVDYNSGGFRTELAGLDKKKTYIVYCRTGRRSTDAVRIMKEMGFTDLLRINGDVIRWKSEKLPLVR
jgi:rhodanese-related sulfurtransferase